MKNTINEQQQENKEPLNKIADLEKQLADKDKAIKENEIMGKILADIVLHNDKFSDERITELLNQEEWKERIGFSVKENGYIGWKNIHWWVIKPQEVFRKKRALALECEELSKQNQEYKEKIKVLETEQANLETEVEKLEERVEIEQEQVKKVVEVGEQWSKAQAEDMIEKNKKLKSNSEKISYLEARVEKLEEESSQKSKRIEKLSKQLSDSESQNESLKSLNYLNSKPLPALPVEEENKSFLTKESMFKQLKIKAKVKIQKLQSLVKKEKFHNQEMTAQVEVKSK